MAKLLRTLISLALALGITAVALPGTATAANPTAYLTKTQYLTATPDPSENSESCTDRNIELRKGHYNWGVREDRLYYVTRANLYLETGTYQWITCLNPQEGTGAYTHYSTLTPLTFNSPPAVTTRAWRLTSSGTYTWGSFLDPLDF